MEFVNIYLDEAGDLGWSFNHPYRNGGSSRYLTIGSVIIRKEKKHYLKRVIQSLYKEFKWNTSKEKKWADMSPTPRIRFSEKVSTLINNNSDISLHAITVKKENVEEHIRKDPNKLYNYMIQLSLINHMSQHDNVTFIPDPRTIKVESGNSLHDYLQTQLWMEKRVKTELRTVPCDSSSNRSIQFSDMLCGVVQSHFEDGKSDPWNILHNKINSKRLFF